MLKIIAVVVSMVSMPALAGPNFIQCQELLKSGWLRFDSSRQMPAGPYRGRVLSPASPAPALVVLDAVQASVFPEQPENHWPVANFISKRGPSIALIPKVTPQRISILRERLVDGTNHLLLRLQFPSRHPIRFWPQNLDGLIDDPLEVTDIVIDFGAHRMVGDENNPYSVMRGLRGSYALQSRMSTTSFKVRMVEREKRKITEYTMTMPKAQRLEILQGFVERSEEINQGEMYNTLVKNCATEMFKLFKGAGVLSCEDAGWKKELVHGVVRWVPVGFIWSMRNQSVSISQTERTIFVAPTQQY